MSSLRSLSWSTLAFVGAGALVGYWLGTSRKPPSSSSPRPKKGGWVLAVNLKFSNAEKLAEFERIFRPVADYVRAHEPFTLEYDMLKSDKDPLEVMIFEKYADKEHAYAEVHKSSAPFKSFRPQLAALEPEISGNSYYEVTW